MTRENAEYLLEELQEQYPGNTFCVMQDDGEYVVMEDNAGADSTFPEIYYYYNSAGEIKSYSYYL